MFLDVLDAFVFLDMNGDDLIQRHELNIQLPKLGLSLKVDQVIEPAVIIMIAQY